MTARRTAVALLSLTVIGTLWSAPSATAAVQDRGKQKNAVLRSVARSAPGYVDVKVRGGEVTMTMSGMRYSDVRHGVFRSAVNKRFFRVDLVPKVTEAYVAVVEKARGRYALRAWGTRWEMPGTLCKQKKPPTSVIYDLALGPVNRISVDGRCRYPRDVTALSRPMAASEVSSIRAMYERVLDPETFEYTSPQEPDFSEISGSCDWDKQGDYSFEPSGRVARSDARFGLLKIGCVTGTVDGVPALNVTDLLVSRAGTSGPFTHLLAHVIPGSSPLAGTCTGDRKWPVGPMTRVSLQFCLPYPFALRSFLGPGSL